VTFVSCFYFFRTYTESKFPIWQTSFKPPQKGDVMLTKKSFFRTFSVWLVVVLLLAGLPPVQPAFAVGMARYVDATGADSGTCTSSASPCLTVAYAITKSNSGDTIHIAAGAYPANLTVGKDLTFIGAGMNQTLLNGGGTGMVMQIPGATTVVNITDLAIANGNGAYGGGINNYGKLSLTRVKVTDNTATNNGGGIFSAGQLSMTDSVVRANTANIGGGLSISVNSPTVNTFTRVTISGNNITTATGYGAGIQIAGTGSMALTNVTISENAIGSGYAGGIMNAGTMIYIVNSTIAYNQSNGTTGGGIHNSSGTINIQNTIVAHNGSKNCGGSLASFGNNLDSLNNCNFIQPNDLRNTDPFLDPLADNGGFTQTHALSGATPLHPQSPAIDAATSCPAADDQRGVSRPQGAHCDIGAYEYAIYKLFLPLLLR
jgi:predicted outer membrane repeat protein